MKQFVRASGTKVIDAYGKEILFRGVGFGTWMLPEGYMWKFPDAGDRPRRIEGMIKELIGEEKAEDFWDYFYNHYVTKKDIELIAKEGFNSVRIPFNYRFIYNDINHTFIEKHLKIIDSCLDWCEEYGIYVILDLHGAPGGQTGTNIDDSRNNEPELFMKEENKELTIKIWKTLALRYMNRKIIAGYDLMNEPLPEWFSKYNDQVMPLYKRIVKAIREVDKNHMIIIEGVHWATDWSIFTEKIDNNLMLQFHKYWSSPTADTIQVYLDKREELNAPIFMGEGGENNKNWYAGVFNLYEEHNISWNFWTWKKLDTNNSPCSINTPNNWHKIINFLNGGEKPSKKEAEEILWEYLFNIKIENCTYYSDVVKALFARPNFNIPAVFYGNLGEGNSYQFSNENIKVNKFNTADYRSVEGAHVYFVDSNGNISFKQYAGEEWEEKQWIVLGLQQEEWVKYRFTIDETNINKGLSIKIIACVEKTSNLNVSIDGSYVKMIQITDKNFSDNVLNFNIKLPIGEHELKLECITGKTFLKSIEFRENI